jgi:hypothetical protein
VPHILDSVIVVEDMLGFVPKLRYTNHDVTEVAKFPEICIRCLHGKKRVNFDNNSDTRAQTMDHRAL